MYQEGTKFEMQHFDGPQKMHQVAMMQLGIGIIWTDNGKSQDDSEYREEFEIIDTTYPENNAKYLSRQECEQRIWDLYLDEICR